MGVELSLHCRASRGARGLFGSRRPRTPKTPARCSAIIFPAASPAATMTRSPPPTSIPRRSPRIRPTRSFSSRPSCSRRRRRIGIAPSSSPRSWSRSSPSHRIARFLLGCEAFKQGNFKEADEHFAAARQGPIADLTSTLARAWVQEADGKTGRGLRHARQSERCRLGPVLSALPPRAHRRHRRQA